MILTLKVAELSLVNCVFYFQFLENTNEIYQVLGPLHSMWLSNGKLRLPLIITNRERVQVARFLYYIHIANTKYQESSYVKNQR